MPEYPTLLLALTGAATGLVGSMLGLGGGVFLVPVLTLGFGFPIRAAIGASLMSVIATASASATISLRRGLVNVRLGMLLEIATTAGGLAGSVVASRLSHRQLFLLFAGTLMAMGALAALRSGRRNVIADLSVATGRLGGRLSEGAEQYVYRVRRLPVAMGASLVAGAIAGLLGLGGGIVKVPVLTTFCGVPIRVAAATSTFVIGVTAAAAVIPYFARGDLVLPVTSAVALGALPGSLLGAWLSDSLETRSLKVLMAAVLLGVGARMGVEGW